MKRRLIKPGRAQRWVEGKDFHLADEVRYMQVGVDTRMRCGHHDYMPRSTVVGARELKTRLGGYLQKVRQGRTLVITDRGEPVAELRPLGGPGPEEAALARLKALGAVTRLENRPLAAFRAVRSRGPSASDAIIEDRRDRM